MGSFFGEYSLLPSHAAMTVLKTVANAWTTRSRLHSVEQWSCIFGCECEDRLRHYLQCPVAMSALAAALGLQMPILAPSITDLFPISRPWKKRNFLYICCLFTIYHSFLAKHRNFYERQPVLSYPLAARIALASVRKAENIGFA